MNGLQQLPPDNHTFWAIPVDLGVEGPNTFIFQTTDSLGNLSESVTVVVQLDTTPPAAPVIVTPAVPTTTSASNPFTVSGTKEAGAFIRLNGHRITEASGDTAWTYQATLNPPPPPPAPPADVLTLTAVDPAGNESVPVTISVTLTGTCVAPPRPIFPLDGNAIQWDRAFSWTPRAGATGYRFELSASPAFDTFVISPPPVLVGTQFLPATFVPTIPAPPAGLYYWRVGTVDASCTSYGPTRKVIIGSTTGDVTGDGFADIFVGVSGDDRVDLEAGAAYLYQGGAIQDVLVDAVMTGQGRHQAFGTALAKAGDIDGDGYVDLLVGAYNADRDVDLDDNGGAAYLYWGGATPATTPGLVFRGEVAGGLFGASVAGIGDVNGDGHPDIAVGAYQTPVTATCGGGTATLPKVGVVYVFLGGARSVMDSRPDFVLTGEAAADPDDPTSACRERDEFGIGVAGPGDVNGDGYDDLVVGARYYDDLTTVPATQDVGRAYVFFGGPWFAGVGAARADVVLTGLSAGDEFGATVAGAGDTDGDGFADLLIGAPLRDGVGIDAGSVSWIFGRSDGVSPATVEIGGAAAGDQSGAAVASAGDINGDGLADIVIGAFAAGPTNNGSATYFYGNTGRTAGSPTTIVGESLPDVGDNLDNFGVSVSGLGDVDGDGFDDTAVGAWQHDVCFDPLNQDCDDAGRAYVILGPHTTTRGAADDPADWLLTGFNLRDGLGVSVR